MTYDAWMEKTGPYLDGMREYLELALNAPSMHSTHSMHSSSSHGTIMRVDKDRMYDALFRYVYRTSMNRFRCYEIIS